MNLKIPGYKREKTAVYMLFLLLLPLLCTPVTAGDLFTIDPVPDQIIWTEEIKVTGTASQTEEAVIKYYLRRGYCSDAEDEQIDPDPENQIKGNGGSSGIRGDGDSTWWIKAGLNDLAPGDYIFVFWREGNEENRIVKNMRVTYTSGDTTMIEVYEPGAGGPVLETEPTEEDSFYAQNTYSTPGSEMELYIIPDLPETGGVVPKGETLLIEGKGVPGKDILVWICKKGVYGSDVYYKTIKPGTGDDGAVNSDNVLLSANETAELLSGQYFIYAVSGTKEEFPGIEHELRQSMLPESILKANEEENPYIKFVMLLEEPWIRFSGAEGGSLPEAVYGSVLNLSGTTNLKAGTELDLTVEPSVAHDPGEFTTKITGVRVDEGSPHTWSVEYNTSGSGTGELVVTISDPTGLAYAVSAINIYDPAFSVEKAGNDSLFVESFNIDPETKDIAKEGSPLNAGTLPTAVLAFEAGLVFLIAVCAIAIYRKR